MPMLSAQFNLEISSPCLLSWPDEENPSFVVPFNDFQITGALLSGKYWGSKAKDEVIWTRGLNRLDLTVSRDEPDPPPDVIITSDGRRDLTVLGQYLSLKLPHYQAAALEITNRVLRFFQYSLSTPLVRLLPSWNPALQNPRWFDVNYQELRGGLLFVIPPVPGLHGELGAKTLSPAELPALQSFIETPTDPSLAVTLLSDAQTAWFEGSLRRSVLELAICTEVLVKRRFFAQASPAGAAFDYLEDKGKISVRVLDLLDAVAEEAFTRSYKKQELGNYQNIDYLFRCRNKIAHRGELSFRDDSGRTVSVDAPLVEAWWHAVVNLKEWLDAL